MASLWEKFVQRLENARAAEDQSTRDFIRERYPGGPAAYEKFQQSITPEEREKYYTPLSTKVLRGAAKGIGSGIKAVSGLAGDFEKRLAAARDKALQALNLK
jgi:hypothetical protein